MHLRSLEIFCDVALHRSFSKAALINEVSQPTASQAVQGLEERLGVELIDRTQRPLVLTPAGEVYFEGCRKLLEEYRVLEDRVLQFRDQEKVVGHVQVAAIYSVGLLQMDGLIRRFNELYPTVKVRVEYLHPDQVLEQVLQEEADLGLLSFPKETRDLTVSPWQEQPLVVVTSAQHPLGSRETLSVRDLNGIEFVGFTAELLIRKQIDKWLRQAKTVVDVVLEFDNIENIKQAVEIGPGVAILPEPTVRREVLSGTLRAVPLHDVQWTRPLGIIHRRQKLLTTAVSRFIDTLRAFTSPAANGGSGEVLSPVNTAPAVAPVAVSKAV